MLEFVERKIAYKLQERKEMRLVKAYGGIQKCPYCKQWAQSTEGWKFECYEEDPQLDVLTCGPCGGESLWLWGMGFHYVRPLNPPKPLS